MKTSSTYSLQCQGEKNTTTEVFFAYHLLGCMRKERGVGGGGGNESHYLEEERGRGTGSIRMHPTSTQHTIRLVLHFANLYPGCWFRVFP